MAITTNYSWTTPDDTALVKDGASAIRTLGTSIDTSVKSLNPGTASGDLDYYTSATTKARIAKGTAGQIFTMNAGATAPEWQTAAAAIPANATATVATQQSTTSTTYTNLATSGPAVTVTTGTKALVILTSQVQNDAGNAQAYMSFAVSGATTTASSDTRRLSIETASGIMTASAAYVVTLTAGSNTFTAQYRVGNTAGTAYFQNRNIFVMNLA